MSPPTVLPEPEGPMRAKANRNCCRLALLIAMNVHSLSYFFGCEDVMLNYVFVTPYLSYMCYFVIHCKAYHFLEGFYDVSLNMTAFCCEVVQQFLIRTACHACFL